MQLGSRPPTKKSSRPATQQEPLTSGGANVETTSTGDTSPNGNRDTGALYLTVDAPHSYQEAMGCVDVDEWVAAITVEYRNLQ